MKLEPVVSIVVTTRNEESVIETLLRSIRAQTYPAIEIIVVDNRSTDATCAMAARYADAVITAGPERSAQRNIGAKASRGDYLLFLDADMELPPTVVEKTVMTVQRDSAIGLVAIPERSDGENYWGRCKALERNCYIDEPSVMAARFFRRDVFEVVGGYDETLTGPEDWDLSQRATQYGKLAILDGFLVHHEGRIDLRSQFRKKFYYAQSFRRYWHKHRTRAQSQWVLLGRSAYLRHWRSFAASPHLAAGFVILRLVESVAGLCGVLYSLRADSAQN